MLFHPLQSAVAPHSDAAVAFDTAELVAHLGQAKPANAPDALRLLRVAFPDCAFADRALAADLYFAATAH